eukprot:Pgem_evm2s200
MFINIKKIQGKCHCIFSDTSTKRSVSTQRSSSRRQARGAVTVQSPYHLAHLEQKKVNSDEYQITGLEIYVESEGTSDDDSL